MTPILTAPATGATLDGTSVTPRSLVGTGAMLVSAVQTLNNARVVFVGSTGLFANDGLVDSAAVVEGKR